MTLRDTWGALVYAANEHIGKKDIPEGTVICEFSLTLVREMRDALELVLFDVSGRA